MSDFGERPSVPHLKAEHMAAPTLTSFQVVALHFPHSSRYVPGRCRRNTGANLSNGPALAGTAAVVLAVAEEAKAETHKCWTKEEIAKSAA
jgi:hypothetical protein